MNNKCPKCGSKLDNTSLGEVCSNNCGYVDGWDLGPRTKKPKITETLVELIDDLVKTRVSQHTGFVTRYGFEKGEEDATEIKKKLAKILKSEK